MKKISFLFFILFSVYMSAQVLHKEIIKKNLKKTQSYKVSDSVSLHFTITRKTKPRRYEFQPYLVGKNVKKLKPFSFNREPIHISSHIKGNKWVYIYMISGRFFVVDYDFTTETKSKSIKLENFTRDYHLKKEDADLFYSNKRGGINLIKIVDSDHIDYLMITPKTEKDKKELIRFDFKIGFDYVKTSEYVAIGSINNSHSYVVNNRVIFSYDESKSLTSFLLLINEKEKTYQIQSYTNDLQNNRQIRSFILGDLLFQFAIDYKIAKLNIFSIDKGEFIKSYTYTKENFGPYNKYYYKKKEVPVNPKKFFKSFANLSMFTNYKPTIFITVNKAIDDSFIVECGHINGMTYSYDPLFMQQMMWQQQQMMKPPMPHFGPYVADYLLNSDDDESLKKTSFILAIDTSFTKLDTIPKSIMEKDKWKKENEMIENIQNKKYFSRVNLENKIRFMYYLKRQKALLIDEIKK